MSDFLTRLCENLRATYEECRRLIDLAHRKMRAGFDQRKDPNEAKKKRILFKMLPEKVNLDDDLT